MKASEIPACAVCARHPLEAFGRSITFHVVTFDRAMLDPRAARSVTGLALQFGGSQTRPLAEVFAPDPHVVKVHEALRSTAVVCEECMAVVTLAQVWEASQAPVDGRVAP